MPEERIRDYILEGLIGRGGMGSVFLASHVHLGTKAALKVLLEQYSDDPSIKERFINEARLLSDLQHPNVVVQKEFFEENGRLVLVMEFVDGRGLDQMIGHEVGPIPWEKALPLFAQILSGVGYAHARGVVHRDIKPANILVSTAGEVKITDFGIAKIAGQKGMTRTGAQMGTLYYEAPEQIRGARDVDHRADIYALGMTLFEMLAGRLPFEGDRDTSEFEVMSSIVNRAEHLDPRVYYPHIPEWLVKTIQKATHLDPEKRFQSCEEFLGALDPGGMSATGEHAYWSGKVASIRPVSGSSPLRTPMSSAGPDSACPKCGIAVKDEMEYCGRCGADLQQECPGCGKLIRWHHEHCPKCGVNIEGKHAELAAEAERKRLEEEHRKAEEARRAEERRREAARLAAEHEALRQQRKQWWRRTGWKVAAGAVVVGALAGILMYLNSDSYLYSRAEKLYQEGDLPGAAKAFSELGSYGGAQSRAISVRFPQDGDIITDVVTGLAWRVCPQSDTDWDAAQEWVIGLGGDWRMPTVAELQGLWDAGITASSRGPFNNREQCVWSGETGETPNTALAFNFVNGGGVSLTASRPYCGRAFAVRSLSDGE